MATHMLFMRETDRSTGLGQRTADYISKTHSASEIGFKQLHEVREGDMLFIVGHGSSKKMTLSGKSPAELAALLTSSGLSKPVNIYLYSCHTGFSGAPYALEFKLEMVQKKVQCSVEAPTASINSKGEIKDSTAKKKSYMTGNTLAPNKPAWAHD